MCQRFGGNDDVRTWRHHYRFSKGQDMQPFNQSMVQRIAARHSGKVEKCSLPDRNRALSTVNSSANRIWQKFFLLLRMAVISPHCPNTSMMSCSLAFSGRPPTNTVLQPGGRSLVAGGGRSVGWKRMAGLKTGDGHSQTWFFFYPFTGVPTNESFIASKNIVWRLNCWGTTFWMAIKSKSQQYFTIKSREGSSSDNWKILNNLIRTSNTNIWIMPVISGSIKKKRRLSAAIHQTEVGVGVDSRHCYPDEYQKSIKMLRKIS